MKLLGLTHRSAWHNYAPLTDPQKAKQNLLPSKIFLVGTHREKWVCVMHTDTWAHPLLPFLGTPAREDASHHLPQWPPLVCAMSHSPPGELLSHFPQRTASSHTSLKGRVCLLLCGITVSTHRSRDKGSAGRHLSGL